MNSSPSSSEAGHREDVPLCRVSCESASVAVLLHPTGNGLRLLLVSERTGHRALLDATVLDALCALTPSAATALVRAAVQEEVRR
ncbi:hypothetical protein ACWIG3_23405 [Streptomyces celluloflavus]|uniref:Uncharacterized protein n=1 Tax=Streptomyces kasugaensis TaxID=1946 RepID=A0A4Q9HRC7_STRKA|nr:hypothetical protein [Streptomyces kasugaensis]TBO57516.1 hypothetical protein EYS09_22300 [Streptomyces kasugaensis]